jgi:hypothetical protein
MYCNKQRSIYYYVSPTPNIEGIYHVRHVLMSACVGVGYLELFYFLKLLPVSKRIILFSQIITGVKVSVSCECRCFIDI